MSFTTSGDREGVSALQRLAEAREALLQAEMRVVLAMKLLEAQDNVSWGDLPPHKLSERRQLLLHAHLAWAKLDRGFKQAAKATGELAARPLQQGGEDERHGSPVEEHRQGDEAGHPGDEDGLLPGW